MFLFIRTMFAKQEGTPVEEAKSEQIERRGGLMFYRDLRRWEVRREEGAMERPLQKFSLPSQSCSPGAGKVSLSHTLIPVL